MRACLIVLVASVLLMACAPDEPVTPPEGETVQGETPEPTGTPEPTPSPEPEPDEASTPATWTRLADAPLELTEVAAAPFGGSLWTAGGLDAEGNAVTAVQVFDPTFDLWERGPDLPEGVHHATLVAADQALYLIGGYVGSGFGQPTASVWMLDVETGDWTDAPALPQERAAGAGAWDGGRLVYGGGVGPGGASGDVITLDPEHGEWQSVGELSLAREHLAAASDGQGRVWFLGGRTGGLDTNVGTVDLLDGDTVRTLSDLPTPRSGLAAFYVPDSGACAAGGEGPQGTFDEVECVDSQGAISALPSLGEARHGLGAAAVDGIAYTLLGGPQPGLFVSGTAESLPLDQVE